MVALKRFVGSLAFSLALVFAAQPLMAQDILHCDTCELKDSWMDDNGDIWETWECDCHIDEM